MPVIDACRRSAAPFFVHFMGSVNAKLEEVRARVNQLCDAFASGQAAFFVLRFDGFRAAAGTNLFFLILDLRNKIDNLAAIFGEVWRLGVDAGFQDRT